MWEYPCLEGAHPLDSSLPKPSPLMPAVHFYASALLLDTLAMADEEQESGQPRPQPLSARQKNAPATPSKARPSLPPILAIRCCNRALKCACSWLVIWAPGSRSAGLNAACPPPLVEALSARSLSIERKPARIGRLFQKAPNRKTVVRFGSPSQQLVNKTACGIAL